MSFSQRKGEKLVDLPADFIHWMIVQPRFFDDKTRLLNKLITLGKIKRNGEDLKAVGYTPWFYLGGPCDNAKKKSQEPLLADSASQTSYRNGPSGSPSAGVTNSTPGQAHCKRPPDEQQQHTPRGQSTYARDRAEPEEPSKKRHRAGTGMSVPVEQEVAAIATPDLSYLPPKASPSAWIR
jgi:hypothetical protein